MGKIISTDSTLYKFTSKLVNILLINFIWIISSIPIITIGASTTAVYYVTLKIVKEEEVYIVKSFIKSFKENFKQSTIMWLIFLVIGVILGSNYYYLFNVVKNPGILFRIVTALVTVLYVFCVLYAFPLLSRYSNSISRTILNSFVVSIRYFSRTIIILVLVVVLIAIGLYHTISFIFTLFFGVGLLTYVVSFYTLKVFEDLERLKEKYEEELMNQKDEVIEESEEVKEIEEAKEIEEVKEIEE